MEKSRKYVNFEKDFHTSANAKRLRKKAFGKRKAK